jgi:hypothetical protein
MVCPAVLLKQVDFHRTTWRYIPEDIFITTAVRTSNPTYLRVRHLLSKEPCGIKVSCVQRDPRYEDFDSRLMLRVESSKYLVTT